MDLKEMFRDVVNKAQAFSEEMDRLSGIEKKLTDKLTDVESEIKGLEKSLTYSGITSLACILIKEQIFSCKRRANQFCSWLGISPKYSDTK